MELTKTQQETISSLEERLDDIVWEHLYYGDNPPQEVIELMREGVELNIDVKLKPYKGLYHPNYRD